MEAFSWIRQCPSNAAFNAPLAEYIHALYVEGEPMCKAVKAVSGPKLLLTQTRRTLDILVFLRTSGATECRENVRNLQKPSGCVLLFLSPTSKESQH